MVRSCRLRSRAYPSSILCNQTTWSRRWLYRRTLHQRPHQCVCYLPLITWSFSANVCNSCSAFITRSNAMCPPPRGNMATSVCRFSGVSALSDALTRRRTGPREDLQSSPALWTASCMVTRISGPHSRRRYRLSPRLMGVRRSCGPTLPNEASHADYLNIPYTMEGGGTQGGHGHDRSTCDG